MRFEHDHKLLIYFFRVVQIKLNLKMKKNLNQQVISNLKIQFAKITHIELMQKIFTFK